METTTSSSTGDTTPGGGTVVVKKKVTPVSKYKAMVKTAPQDTTSQQPLMVEKADGTIGPWGNPITPPKPVVPAQKPQMQLSDKAKGYSNTYYNPNR